MSGACGGSRKNTAEQLAGARGMEAPRAPFGKGTEWPSRKSPIPDELWTVAINTARKQGVNRIAQQLHAFVLSATTAAFGVSKKLVQNDAGEFRFLDPGELGDDGIILRLVATQPADPVKNWVPYYVFHIMKSAHRAGEIHLRIGNTEHMRLYGGHVAYGVRPEFRGNHFAGRALRLLMPLAVRHGLSELWITCNPENFPSRRTCEFAGAELIQIIDLPPDVDMYQEGERQKCRYRLDLLTGT